MSIPSMNQCHRNNVKKLAFIIYYLLFGRQLLMLLLLLLVPLIQNPMSYHPKMGTFLSLRLSDTEFVFLSLALALNVL